jgi:hypothetical protein
MRYLARSALGMKVWRLWEQEVQEGQETSGGDISLVRVEFQA